MTHSFFQCPMIKPRMSGAVTTSELLNIHLHFSARFSLCGNTGREEERVGEAKDGDNCLENKPKRSVHRPNTTKKNGRQCSPSIVPVYDGSCRGCKARPNKIGIILA